MTYLVILNGVKPNREHLLAYGAEADVILSADGGARYLYEAGMHMDMLMGDMDSIEPDILEAIRASGTKIITHPTHKDETDGQLVLDYAVDHGAKRIIVMGGEGGRLDHMVANIMLLRRMAGRGVDTRMILEGGDVRCCRGTVEIYGKVGDTVSILPFGDGVVVAEVRGLEYAIDKPLTMPMDIPMGISNVLTDDTARIDIASGWALIFHYAQGGIA